MEAAMGVHSRIGNAVLSCVFACILGFGSSSAVASTNTTEITDMWFDPAESGWGVNIILQKDVAFMTFFVYDTNQNPVWYTAELRYQGPFVWSGALYATRGPWFGGPFPPASVTIRQAGTASFSVSANDYNRATLTYVVDGVSVIKSLQRQTWTFENYSGQYAGGYSIRATGCVPSSQNGIQEIVGFLGVTQSGTSISISLSASPISCSFSGTYSQKGKLGRLDGTYSCTDGTQGSFFVYDMTPTVNGFNGRAVGQNQYCQWAGYVGGIRRAP
jgi:hypothetical protein